MDQTDVLSVASSAADKAAANATILDLLAQTCVDVNAAVQELSVEEVATGLAHAVSLTQKSLRSVGQNVDAILQDPEQIRELCYHVKQADAKMHEVLQHSAVLLDEEHRDQNDGHRNGGHRNDDHRNVDNDSSSLLVQSDKENVRNMMMLVEGMCTTMDHALSTITQDELALAAQLSLNLAQKLLNAGQSLFTALGDDERRIVRAGDHSDRITIEELEEDDEEIEELKSRGRDEGRRGQKNSQLERASVLRTYVLDLYHRTREEAVEHPFMAGALFAAGLPFLGLAIPMTSLVAVALMVEKYYPEHAKLVLELCSNFIQMAKLWFLLLKIGTRQVSVMAKESFNSWYEYASVNGFMATGLEVTSTGCSLGYFGVSYLYQMIIHFTQKAIQ